MKYFKEFPKINYPFVINGKIEQQEITDIFLRLKIINSIQSDPFAIYEYTVQDNDRPDTIADDYYGDPDLAWLVMLSNNFSDFYFDLPKSEEQLVEYVSQKYSVNYQEMFQTVHHYEDQDGHIVDEFSYAENPLTVVPISIYDHEFKLNEKNRRIKLISKKYTQQVVNEFREKISQIEESRENSISSFINDN